MFNALYGNIDLSGHNNITYTYLKLTKIYLTKKILIHIENKELICKDTEMTSSLGKTYTIIETRSLDYF